MSSDDELIELFQRLNIEQRQLIRDVIEEIINTETTEVRTTQRDRITNPQFVSSDGTELAIGDRVQILSTRKTGRYGDFATIVKFNKKYVAIILEKNQSQTQRDSKYLRYIS